MNRQLWDDEFLLGTCYSCMLQCHLHCYYHFNQKLYWDAFGQGVGPGGVCIITEDVKSICGEYQT